MTTTIRCHVLALAVTLLAALAGCGSDPENCAVDGDEDGDGMADCSDTECAADPSCPRCSNGTVGTGEGCDDGNLIDTDACTATCQPARCGDGIVQAGVDECDDGNTVDGDACTNACTDARCGDGVVGPDEDCDDGNPSNTDGCTNMCEDARCGDGFAQPGEECDDGNMVDTDACTSTCTNARCGDGFAQPGEECDDGNMANTDACTNTCMNMRCGDGFAQPGEACDDGNMSNVDGCTNACRLPTCGDGFMQGAEQCDDGNMVNTDGCLNTCMTAVCGDGVTRAGVEECDDANMVETDACRNTCVAARCGDGIIRAGVEQCDDANMVNTDACTNVCMIARCGDGFVQGTEVCDDGNVLNTDSCTNACMPARCGDGFVQGNETCDDGNMTNGDGCDNTCISLLCGNGNLDAQEQCDDGNHNSVDGCSPSCRFEAQELEPNEDGTPSTSTALTTGNDFDVGGMLAITNATAQGVLRASAGNTARLATLVPAGDEDVFAIMNDGATATEIRLDTWNAGPGFGAGVPCAVTMDTVINLRNADGAILLVNDDRNGAADRCSTMSTVIAAGTTVYAHVVVYGDTLPIAAPGYGLQVRFVPIVCGDGTVTAVAEECDDGNNVAGDGCSPTCVVEGTNELEPNEDGTPQTGGGDVIGNDFDVGGMLAVTNATAQGVHDVAVGRRNWLAALMPAGDEDVFVVTNGGAVAIEVQADTWNPQQGVGAACNLTVDTVINVRDAAGVIIVANDQRTAVDNCSQVNFVLAPGQTRYLQVIDYIDDSVIARYVLAVTGRPVVCGNGVQTPSFEECDDGNVVNGDGCSAACVVEGTGEVEPNEDGTPSVGGVGIAGNDFDVGGMLAITNATAQGVIDLGAGDRTWRGALSPAGDEDVVAVTNSGANTLAVQLDTRDLAVGIGRPCAVTDTGINVRDAAGLVVASNDNRAAGDLCSRVTFVLATGQTRYVHVTEQGDNAAIMRYALVLDATPVVCGDNLIGPGEECDGGNAVPGDGCGATCQLEGPVTEVEPNGNPAEADAAPAALQIGNSAVIRGAISPMSNDIDVYRVTVAQPTVIRFETFAPLPGDCDTTATTIRLLDSAGVLIASDTSSGIASCSAIVMPLAVGTYYLQVEGATVVPRYFLEIRYQSDKGTEAEAVGMMGTNDTVATADLAVVGGGNVFAFGDHTLNADVDVYALTVPAGGRIRVEIIEGNRGTVPPAETCESFEVDSLLELRDPAGALIVSDDDAGRGFCSKLDGTGTVPANPLARNATAMPATFYLMVKQSTLADLTGGQFVYRLQVTIR